MSEFKPLIQRRIIDVLIGDTQLLEGSPKNYSMPYYTGSMLCDISTKFGLEQIYSRNGDNLSRWEYFQNLLEYLDEENRIPELLDYLFRIERFRFTLKDIKDEKKVLETYEKITAAAISAINAILLFSHQELKRIGTNFYLAGNHRDPIIATHKVKIVNVPYIQSLTKRVEEDLANKNYDSVVTKSRTLLEEVILHILEKTGLNIPENGNLIKLYVACKQVLGIQQQREWDKRVNEMLSGLEKIVQAISRMRNMNSDAHGAGSKRIAVRDYECKLIVNATITLCEYLLSLFESKHN